MDVLMVGVCTDHDLEPATDKPTRKFYAQLVGALRAYLTGGIRMDKVIAEYTAHLAPTSFRCLHVVVGRIGTAVDRRLQNALTAGSFLAVQRIADAVIQTAVNGDYLVICHYTLSFTKRHALRASSAASCISALVLPL